MEESSAKAAVDIIVVGIVAIEVVASAVNYNIPPPKLIASCICAISPLIPRSSLSQPVPI